MNLHRASTSRFITLLSKSGFTLIEVVLTLACISLLMVFLFPTLRGARGAAELSATTSLLRQHATVFSAYAADYDDRAPYYVDPTATFNVVRAGPVIAQFRYFDGKNSWNIALSSRYYDGVYCGPFFVSPRALREALQGHPCPGLRTPFYYSNSFFADPSYWLPETRRSDRSQWRSVRLSEVTHASKKGVLIDTFEWFTFERASNKNRIPVAFVDGSARLIGPLDFMGQYHRGAGDGEGSEFDYPIPTMHTINGVRGRDVE